MTDLDQYKQLFLLTGLNFTSHGTIMGISVITIYPDSNREVDFEFDGQTGKFIRAI